MLDFKQEVSNRNPAVSGFLMKHCIEEEPFTDELMVSRIFPWTAEYFCL